MAVSIIEPTQILDATAPPLLIYGSPGCLSGDTFIPYKIRDKSGRNQNGKGGSLELLFKRFHGLPRPGKGYYQRQQTLDSLFFVTSMTDEGKMVVNRIVDVIDSGRQTVFQVTTDAGRSIKATAKHPFAVPGGSFAELYQLRAGDQILVHPNRVRGRGAKRVSFNRPQRYVAYHPSNKIKSVNGHTYRRVSAHHLAYEAKRNGLTVEQYADVLNTAPAEVIEGMWTVPDGMEVHHLDENPLNNHPDNLELASSSDHQRLFHSKANAEHIAFYAEPETIIAIEECGVEQVYDISCQGPHHNFVAEGFVVHNSWKTSIAQTAASPVTLDFDRGAHRSALRRQVARFDCWADVVQAGKDKLFDPYETVVIDTIGHCLDLLGIAIVDESPKNGNRNGGLSIQGWGVLKTRFGSWVRGFRAEGKQIVMLAHEKEEKDGDNRLMRPAISGGSYGVVMEMCDLVGYLSVRNGKRVLDFNPTDQYHGKNSAGWKPVPVPDLKTSGTFLADLLADARKVIGRTAESSAAAAQAVERWGALLAEVTSAEGLNSAIGEVSGLTNGTKAQVWSLFLTRAKELSLSYDKTAKRFAAKEVA